MSINPKTKPNETNLLFNTPLASSKFVKRALGWTPKFHTQIIPYVPSSVGHAVYVKHRFLF